MLKEHDPASVSVAEIALNGERRRCGRLYAPYPVRVRGVARTGEAFTVETAVDDIGAGGFYLRLPVEVDPEQPVRAVVCFKAAGDEARGAARLWIRGRVLRSEPQPDGRHGVAVGVMNYRLLRSVAPAGYAVGPERKRRPARRRRNAET